MTLEEPTPGEFYLEASSFVWIVALAIIAIVAATMAGRIKNNANRAYGTLMAIANWSAVIALLTFIAMQIVALGRAS